MIDYYPLLTNAVAGLGDQNTTERRRALYDRGRKLISTRAREIDPSAFDREIAAFDQACRRVEETYKPKGRIPQSSRPATSRPSMTNVGSDLLLHLFGDAGLASLRAGNWKFIAVIAPVFGFFADVCTVFGHSAPTLFFISLILAATLSAPIVLRTKYCHHCAIPCVFTFILAIAFGFVAATQKVFAAEESGAAAKFIPGISEIQTALADMLEIQRAPLSAVTAIQSDTVHMKQQLTKTEERLSGQESTRTAVANIQSDVGEIKKQLTEALTQLARLSPPITSTTVPALIRLQNIIQAKIRSIFLMAHPTGKFLDGTVTLDSNVSGRATVLAKISWAGVFSGKSYQTIFRFYTSYSEPYRLETVTIQAEDIPPAVIPPFSAGEGTKEVFIHFLNETLRTNIPSKVSACNNTISIEDCLGITLLVLANKS